MKKPNKKSGKAAKTTKAKLAHSQKNTGSSTLNNEGINRDELDSILLEVKLANARKTIRSIAPKNEGIDRDELDSILFLIDHRNAQKAAESKTPKQNAK